jgi:hypothetical protein
LIWIGSTHCLTPNRYVDDLKKLRQPLALDGGMKSLNDLQAAGSTASHGETSDLRSKFRTAFKGLGKKKDRSQTDL